MVWILPTADLHFVDGGNVNCKYLSRRLCLLLWWFSSVLAHGDALTVRSDKAAILEAPSSGAKVLSYVKRGKTLEATGESQNGFYLLKTKSGRKVFIKATDVEPAESSVDSDLVSEEAPTKNKSFRRFRFDGGGSVGSSSQGSIYEINLGVSYYILEWLSWRNAPFLRIQTGTQNAYGLDSSIRGQYSPPVAADFSPTLLVGAGFRFINTGSHAPFAEVGLGLRLSEVNLQVGIKYIANEFVDSSSENEMIFNGGFSASGSF